MRIALLFALLVVACSAPAPDTRLAAGEAVRPSGPPTSIPTPIRLPSATLRVTAATTPCATLAPAGIAGPWRPSTVTLVADSGTAAPPSIASIGGLCLEPGSIWRYGTASGAWSIAPIAPDDWKRWGMPAQAEFTQKLVLASWPGGPADGPIEFYGDQPYTITLVTRVGPPVYPSAGNLSISFGR